ncbi:MAG: leucine--tRNA ligase, partial [Erysipelotrichia bacterium]|nr:leucine--tRNA ligase [Erysipelotrichia bacterium]
AVSCAEPWQRLFHQGMILGENGVKMSKSLGNVINPDELIASHGADALRLYEMFMGPLEASLPWSAKGMDGARKWLERVWRLATGEMVVSEDTPELDYSYHFMIKKVTSDIDTLNMNTAISQMMIFINDCYKNTKVSRTMMLGFIKMLSCFCPHIGEEMYQILTGSTETIAYEPWPICDESKLALQEVTIIVQVNGKVRGRFDVPKGTDQETLIKRGTEIEAVQSFLSGKTVVKTIAVPDKIVNIVVR